MIRVPRDPFGHRAGPARARLATITTDPSSPPRCSNLPRSRSPRGDRARFGSLTSRMLGPFRMRSPFGNRLRTSSLTLRCSRSRTDSSPYSARSVQRPCSPRCSCPRPDSLTFRRSSPSTFTLTRATARLCCSLEPHIHARPARAHVHVSCAVIFRCSRTFHARAHPAAFMSALACMIRLSTSHACGARVCAHPSLRSRKREPLSMLTRSPSPRSPRHARLSTLTSCSSRRLPVFANALRRSRFRSLQPETAFRQLQTAARRFGVHETCSSFDAHVRVRRWVPTSVNRLPTFTSCSPSRCPRPRFVFRRFTFASTSARSVARSLSAVALMPASRRS